MKLVMAAATDVGTVRDTNEDFFYYSKSNHLIIVCDGMGGHQSGAVASRIAGKTMRDVYFHADFAELARLGEDVMDRLPPLALRLVVGARLANHRLRLMAERDRNLRGMGTTLVALAFGENSACVVHVGDSRLYCLRNQNLAQITQDHSLINQLLQDRDITQAQVKHFRKKNVLTRALGTHPAVKVDVQWFPVRTSDIFMLCTDGLHNALNLQQIATLLLRYKNDVQKMADTLVQEAKAANGSDNITAAVVCVGEVLSEVDTKNVEFTVAEESSRTASFENKFIKEKYPLAKSGTRLGRMGSKLHVWALAAGLVATVIIALAYGMANRSWLAGLWNKPDEGAMVIASPDISATAGAVKRNKQATTATAKPVSGHLVFLHVSDPRQLERLCSLPGVRLLDQFDPDLSSESYQGKSGQLNRPIPAGSYSLFIVDSMQSIVYRKADIRLQSPKVSKDTTTAPARVANNVTTTPPATVERPGGNNLPAPSVDTVAVGQNEIDTPIVRQQFGENESQSKNGGKIFLSGLQNPQYLENNIFANDILIGKVKEFAEAGFWLSPGTYHLAVKDSTGRILFQKENVTLEKGNVKLIEFNKGKPQ
jgi:protein phosphatase